MIELTDQQRHELSVLELELGDYDPEEGGTFVNEVMAEDDANDPYLDGIQHYGKLS